MTLMTGFTGGGKEILADVPVVVPHKRLDATQRAHVQSLIAREHRGTESELRALNRVIAKTSVDLTKLRGVSNSQGVELTTLVEIRMENLCAYRAELEPCDG